MHRTLMDKLSELMGDCYNMDLSLTKNLAKQIRKDIVEMTYAIGTSGTHIGGSLSMVELITVLYNDFLLYDKNNMQNHFSYLLTIHNSHEPGFFSLHHFPANKLS